MCKPTFPIIFFGTYLLLAGVLSGCAGTKVLKEPQPIQTTRPLSTASDERLSVTLDWVIVRDGPGTWAKNADWDEYLLRVSNQSELPLQITAVSVTDSLETAVASQRGRKALVKASKRSAKRYKTEGVQVKAGSGATTMLITGAAVTVAGVGVASAAVYGAALGSSATGAATAASGLLLLGPALAVGSIVRSANNRAVNRQIELRQTAIPIEIAAGEELVLDAFFPIVPSPQRIEIIYADTDGEYRLLVDTSAALSGLHIAPSDQ